MTATLDSKTSAAHKFTRVCDILAEYNYRPNKLIPILQKVQDEYRYLPPEILNYIATSLKLPAAHVYGVATFYAHFALEPKGKYIFRLCDGTACHVKNSIPILEALQEKLGLSSSQVTTEDMLFTVETVSCLGACGLAPVMLVNEDVHGQVTPARAVEIVDEIKAKEEGHVDDASDAA
jgi:NADH-quinone oxidoreductase subunit E